MSWGMKIRSFFSLLNRGVSHFVSRMREERFRLEQEKRNVSIHPKAKIVGAFNITLGAETQIHENALLTTTNLSNSPNDHIYTHPLGSISMGERCTVLPGAILASYIGKIEIGDDVSINPYCLLYGHSRLVIGSKTRIASHTVIVPANHKFDDVNTPIMDQGVDRKGVTIGEDVWIGSRVTILDGVTIGNQCVIAAGSVVTKSFPDRSVIAGVPAKLLKKRGESN